MAYNYPYGNGQQLNLDWFLNEWKNLLAAWEAEKNGIEGALQAEIDRAEAALADVFAARDAAAQSAANALESKNAAAQSASDASGYLATVRADANTASNAAQNAAQSESNAAESAQTALASKNTAANSERNAAQSEANALTSKNAAAQSASDADASKSAAAQSAADADASKSAAAQSAEDASDAAASVEASAQQIATNANDIANLKSFTREIASTPEDELINNIFDTSNQYNEFGRKVTVNKNIVNENFVSTNVIPQSTTLTGTGGTINETISNYRPTISQLKPIALLPKKFLLNAFFDIVGQSFTVAVAIKFCQVDESENITYLPFVTATADQTQKLASAEINIENYPTATHFSILYYTRNSDPTIPTKIVIGIKPQTILNSDLTQLKASLLENIGG